MARNDTYNVRLAQTRLNDREHMEFMCWLCYKLGYDYGDRIKALNEANSKLLAELVKEYDSMKGNDDTRTAY